VDRIKTQLWPAGSLLLPEPERAPTHGADTQAAGPLVAAGSERPDALVSLVLPEAPSEATRVLSARELVVMRQAQRESLSPRPTAHVSSPAPAPRSIPAPETDRRSACPSLRGEAAPAVFPTLTADSEVQQLRSRLSASARLWKRLALVLVVSLLAGGGWYVRRASAVSRVAATVAMPRVSPRQPSAEPAAHEAPAVPSKRVAAASRSQGTREAPPVLARTAVDALASGDDVAAARLYRALASQAAQNATYLAAAEILAARAQARTQAALRAPK
jgi:hypothetical protein